MFKRKIIFSLFIAFIFSSIHIHASVNPLLDSLLAEYRKDSIHASPALLNKIGGQYYIEYTYDGYNRAIIFFQAALDKARKENNERLIADSYELIAGVYDAINMSLDTAEIYYENGLRYNLRAKDTLRIIQSYRNVMVINYKLNKKEQLRAYSDKLYSYLQHYSGPYRELYKNQLAIYYAQNNNLPKASEMLTPVDLERTAAENNEVFRNYFFAQHFIFLGEKKHAEGIAFLQKVLPYTTLAIDSMALYGYLSDHYIQMGDYKNGYLTQNEAFRISSRYEQEVNRDKIAKTVTFYRNEQKEKERMALKEKSESETKLKNYALVVLFLLALVVIIIALVARQTVANNKLLKTQKEEVERLNRLNQKIFSVISHDFNSPLLSMNLLLDVLKSRNYQKEELDEYASDISNQITQSKLILENLLSWARAELQVPQNYPGKKIRSNVHAVVTEVSGQFHTAIKDKNLRVINSVPENIRVKVLPDILKIVFRNLLSNAIKFSHPEGRIEIGMNTGDNTFFIKDEGLGIDANQQEQLFKAAVGNRLGTSNETGFGLGLYMTYELVHKSNGRISLKSEPGKGSIFILALPIDENN